MKYESDVNRELVLSFWDAVATWAQLSAHVSFGLDWASREFRTENKPSQ